MKNFKNILKIITLLVISVNTISLYVKADELNPDKGDLRCPINSTNCRVTREENDKVMEVEVTENSGNYKVTKTVSKTDEKGKLNIKFNVQGGNNSKIQVSRDAYIVVVFDVSSSINQKFNDAKQAIIQFSNTLKGDGVNFALVQFASFLSNRNVSFSTSQFLEGQFCGYKECGMNSASRIEIGLKKASELFDSNPDSKDSNKFVVVFGDGRYWDDDDTCFYNCNNLGSHMTKDNVYAVDEINKLKQNGVILYAIRYPSNYSGEDSKNIAKMEEIAGSENTISITNNMDYNKAFTEIANKILEYQKKHQINVSAILTDEVGSKFTANTKNLSWNISDLNTNNGVNVGNFEVTIKSKEIKESNWYETNKRFRLQVGDDIIITSTTNPEVYWDVEPGELEACSSIAYIKDKSEDSFEYYDKVCDQGIGTNIDGFKATISVNNLELGKKTFTLENGYGFPATISLSNEVKCTYTFKVNEYNDYYNNLKKQLNTNDKREINRINDEIEKLKTVINKYNSLVNYTNNINSDFSNYVKNFEKVTPILTVKYKNSSQTKNVNYENISNVLTNSNCSNTYEVLSSGENIIKNQVCTLKVSKDMQLPSSCINITNGKVIDCSVTKNIKLNGGNNFYPEMDKSGYISIKIPKEASYLAREINLSSENCQFSMKKANDVIYRIIDVSDPFLSTYSNKERSVGINWKNNQFDFVNIIDSKIWSKDSMYIYKLSKVNVENIRSSTTTSNDKVTSYTGVDCSISKDNKYECDFLKNKTTSGSNAKYFEN